jgi:hypothetical protein
VAGGRRALQLQGPQALAHGPCSHLMRKMHALNISAAPMDHVAQRLAAEGARSVPPPDWCVRMRGTMSMAAVQSCTCKVVRLNRKESQQPRGRKLCASRPMPGRTTAPAGWLGKP